MAKTIQKINHAAATLRQDIFRSVNARGIPAGVGAGNAGKALHGNYRNQEIEGLQKVRSFRDLKEFSGSSVEIFPDDLVFSCQVDSVGAPIFCGNFEQRKGCYNYSSWRRAGGIKSMQMSIIEALEKLAELNGYEEILVKIKDDDEPTLIDLEIDDIRKFADDPDQKFDLIVTEYTIRELDENGNEKLGEPLYKVVK